MLIGGGLSGCGVSGQPQDLAAVDSGLPLDASLDVSEDGGQDGSPGPGDSGHGSDISLDHGGDVLDGGASDADGNVPNDAAPEDATIPDNALLISCKVKTDAKKGTFASLQDFAKSGPSCLRGGETILLENGCTYHGTLSLRACHAASGGVDVRGWGSGSPATVTSGQTLADLGLSWTHEPAVAFGGKVIAHLKGAPLYRTGPFTDSVVGLFYREKRMVLARAPNRANASDTSDRYYHTTKLWEHDPNGCQAAACIVGRDNENPTALLRAYGLTKDTFAVMRTSDWALLRSRITWFSPTQNAFAIADSLRRPENGNTMPTVGYGFILVNAPWLIDEAREWAYDSATKMLYFWPSDSALPPSSQTVVVLGRSHTIDADFSGENLDLTIEGLRLTHAGGNGLHAVRMHDLTVRKVIVEDPTDHGFYAWKVANATFEDCKINGTPSDGITVFAASGAARLLHNDVSNAGRIENQRKMGMSLNGVRLGGCRSIEMKDNTVRGTGYAGISTGTAETSFVVRDNQISTFCQVLNDCGGIYINGLDATLHANQTVSNNTLLSGMGNTAGTSFADRHIASAIYLDHSASDFVVKGNIITKAHSITGGIFVNGGVRNQVSNNTVSAEFGPAFGMRRDQATDNEMDSNTVNGNTFRTSSKAWGVIRLTSYRACTDMKSAIKQNSLIHTQGGPDFTEACP